MRLGQRGNGAGHRSPVPAALSAVGAGGRCTEVRHRCPRTRPSGRFPRAGCTTWACAIAVPVEGADDVRHPALPGRRTLTVVVCVSRAVGSWRSLPRWVPLWYESSYGSPIIRRGTRNRTERYRSDLVRSGHEQSARTGGPSRSDPHETPASSLLSVSGRSAGQPRPHPVHLGPHLGASPGVSADRRLRPGSDGRLPGAAGGPPSRRTDRGTAVRRPRLSFASRSALPRQMPVMIRILLRVTADRFPVQGKAGKRAARGHSNGQWAAGNGRTTRSKPGNALSGRGVADRPAPCAGSGRRIGAPDRGCRKVQSFV
ncbi:hypothetical protein CTZ28_24085 [Streptomyces shenzhenensis]|uniref:Uncharacterized protein n=1 Tax=Streptomyces shenzhenensis TaxID=943815 RepID=A0A3M0I560_9ACTN|nr:hypothetical protein CTZ28_24085 [Streptomyces shenzhenensis]